MKKEQIKNRKYYCLFRIDTEYGTKYSIIFAKRLAEANKIAVKKYGAYVMFKVLTEKMFEKAGYIKLYKYTPCEQIDERSSSELVIRYISDSCGG